MAHTSQPQREKMLEAEVERLRLQLKQANVEKNEISSEYDKLSTICRSQRQQLHGIKQALASTTPPSKTASKTQSQQELKQVVFNKSSSSSPDQNSWQAFPDDPKTPTLVTNDNSKSVRTINSYQNRSGGAIPATKSPVTAPVTNFNQSQCFSGSRNNEQNFSSQPPGWAAF